jgi:hypothetical protein
VFGAGFLVKPELVSRFGLRWTDPAGRTEVRCYYGAVSWAIGAFLVHQVVEDRAVDAVTLALLLAGAVLLVRVIGTVVDGARSEAYTRVAIPTEAAFVVALAVARLTA